ncbi:MAG: hypothetical protein GQ582_00255 [Methyloprofundus sp.]|nr:hypothetical protein [Methyloprofundus sp.]
MSLPLVLAGPIVRRVDTHSVSIWIATSTASSITLQLWNGAQTSTEGIGLVNNASAMLAGKVTKSTQLFGQNLHITVITLDFDDPQRGGAQSDLGSKVFIPNNEYAYDLSFNGTADLRSLGLLSDGSLNDTDASAPDHLALGYIENRLPSFIFLPATEAELVLAQASCRKTTSDGEDATGYLDEQIEQAVISNGLSGHRPHQLFLTGDQIYADDVAGPLLTNITQRAEELLGIQEPMQMGGGNDPQAGNDPQTGNVNTERVPLNTNTFPAMSRQRLCYVTGQMTSSDADNHLLGFGEYAAMYLLAWSTTLWTDISTPAGDDLPPSSQNADPRCTRFDKTLAAYKAELETAETALKAAEIALKQNASSAADHQEKKAAVGRAERCYEDRCKVEKLWKEERKALQGYRDGIPRMRRLLANVSSYMVFDDHEVTDDWNITQEWTQRVMACSFSQNIFRNGLASFALFQAWGNDPDYWNNLPSENNLLQQTVALVGSNFSLESIEAINTTLGVGAATPALLPQVKWNFKIDFPTHILVGLDTRHHRHFESPFSPPGLLTDEQISDPVKAQVPLPNPLQDALLVVISPAPLLAPPLIDHIALPVVYPILDVYSTCTFNPKHIDRPRGQDPIAFTGQTFVDTEAWAINDQQFEKFLARIALHSRVLVVSGDVHYSCAFALDYWTRTDSSMSPSSRIVQFTSSGARNKWPSIVRTLFSSIHTLDGLLAAGTPAERLRWTRRDEDDVLPFDSPITNGFSAPQKLRSQLYYLPVIVPTHGWSDTSREERIPDSAWRMQMVVDERPNFDVNSPSANARPAQVSPPDVMQVTGNLETYRNAINRHAASFEHGDAGRKLLWEHNTAIITFSTDNGVLNTHCHHLGRNPKHAPPTQYAQVLSLQSTDFALSATARPRIGTIEE